MFFRHSCNFKIISKSNVIQYDIMGYPLRLCICQCKNCGKTAQHWVDTNRDEETDVVLKWNEVKNFGQK